MQKQPDPYNILNISKNASQEEIRKAYKKQAIEYHPDKTAGDKDKEEHFKKVNEAYSILNDPQKREMYDKFGIIDNGVGSNAAPPDLSDMLKNMFTGGGAGIPGTGFSFVFGGGADPFGGDGDIFGNLFGGHGAINPSGEVIDVLVSLSEIYHGTTKKIEFEILDMCHKCNGTGAQDPSCVLKCMICKGEGNVAVQVNPFMMTLKTCDSCGGTGSVIKNGKFCGGCKGRKTQFTKKSFELVIPKGIPHGHIVKMSNKGSWNEANRQYNSITFRIIHDVKPPYQIQGNDVQYTMDITLDDLLCGFDKEIDLYGEKVKIISVGYFNPSKPHVVQGKGLPNKKAHGNLIVTWNVVYEDDSRLIKLNNVFQKIFKRKVVDPSESRKLHGPGAEIVVSQ